MVVQWFVCRVVKSHPALGHAAMLVAAAVNEEGAKAGTTSATGQSNRGLTLSTSKFISL